MIDEAGAQAKGAVQRGIRDIDSPPRDNAPQDRGIVLRRFDIMEPKLRAQLLKPLQEWQPQGLVVYSADVDRVRKVRSSLPGIPIVSTTRLPAALIESAVGSDWSEIFQLCHRRFLSSGAVGMALFCAGNRTAAQAARSAA